MAIQDPQESLSLQKFMIDMVYYLNEVELKYLTLNLRPASRLNPVPEELRGWNWHLPPLKPYYDVKLPMYLICGNYCPSGRDVYFTIVEKVKGEEEFPLALGKSVHYALAEAIRQAKRLNFDAKPPEFKDERIDRAVKLVWDYTITACKSAFLKTRAEQPYASEEDVILTSMPFLVEHRLDGSLLGCSGIISVDCYDFLHNIVFDVKVGEGRRRLYTTGYALVIESIYEIPVDIGCVVTLNFGESLSITKDLHYIDANLRSQWIEERDRKAEIAFKEIDPGKAENCSRFCLYRSRCL
jgi:CRISPR-associated protein Csa1